LKKIFKDTFEVRLNEVNHLGKTKPVHILNWFQHASSTHSSVAGYPVTSLIKKNLTWVITRYHIIINKYPGWRDKISVSTWRSGERPNFAPREFKVEDDSGNKLIYATSSFKLLDLKTKQTVSPKIHLPDYPVYEKREIQDEFLSLFELKNPDFEKQLNVRRSDLDINRHVNNTLYLEWAIESIPEKIFNDFKICEIEIGFNRPSFYGDKIISMTKACDNSKIEFFHKIVRIKDNTILAKLKTKWTMI
jgi:acyl-ACP thioesterase